ncbi:GNAT family N-acetyltransferase [Moritella sp. 36]|uniref:GNAT family N-acetyltransferase n=1 Tax=Moritella sp. 36 TaxID=2746233 RepID=UPI001BA866E3|nr:GNAT family N-acetyltransferase [Moritella sp. 36]QUM88055.1 GNAT family N-acetyltransferase [Moritella sp. 36]
MEIIRPVKVTDAHALSALFSQLNNETPFMAMGEKNSATELSEHLALFINSATQVLYVIERDNHKLIGFAIGITGYISGDSQTASLVIGIQQASICLGLGGKLLAHVEAWARLSKLKQLELTVMIANKSAIVFYKNNGFKQLISKPQGMIDGLAENELYMVKAVNLD